MENQKKKKIQTVLQLINLKLIKIRIKILGQKWVVVISMQRACFHGLAMKI